MNENKKQTLFKSLLENLWIKVAVMTYHINPKSGNADLCRATHGRCPFGSLEEHYSTLEEAYQGFLFCGK